MRKLHRRSFRERERAFLLEGPAPVSEALRMGHVLEEVLLEAGSPAASEVRPLAEDAGVPILDVSRPVMEAASGTATPQGVLAVARMPATRFEELPEGAALILVSAGVSDPGNAGTLLRSALAAGADAMVFLAGSVDPFGPKTVRASAGTVLRTPILSGVEWDVCRDALHRRGIRTVGSAARSGVPLDDADLGGRIALVVGNEAAGLPKGLLDDLDEIVSIPMPGPVESLNAAVAGSILLFEITRRARTRTAGPPVSFR